jgi:hypothetical protein
VSRTGRTVVLAVVILVAVVGSLGYVLHRRGVQERTVRHAPPVATRSDLGEVRKGPYIVFRDTALGGDYGRAAAVPLTAPSGPRALTPASCDRVYATNHDALCLSADRGVVTTYSSTLLNDRWAPTHHLPITGIPSRARLSRDGSLAATTNFVFGDTYANPGQFSTRTFLSKANGGTVGELESFSLMVDGKKVTRADRNFWGVTFADDDHFYATAAAGHTTWLVKGSISAKSMTSVRTDVECPSLSPDKTRIAFKKHGHLPPGQWRLAVYDLRTGGEQLLSESRSVDDQIEWLDNRRVVYGLPRTTAGTASSDVWAANADGTGRPTILIPDAESPAVVR